MEQIFILPKRGFLLAVFMCFNFFAFAQQEKEVSGTVTDATTGEPVLGVNVLVEGTNRGAVTDFDGNYSIRVAPDESLTFTFIGFESQTIEVGEQTNIDVSLSPDDEALEEVVVVAFGEQKKVSVTGAVSSIGNKELRQSSSASFANALSGRLPGLTSIQSGGGQPGRDDPAIFLRGAATTNGTSPLILIDGVPRDNIRTLDANEIESVTVLKDASATAVFGVRGANGVILITTRRGAEGTTELSISAEQSFTSFTREPERLHSLEYMALRNEAALNDGTTPPFSEQMMDRYENPLAGLDPNDPDYEEQARIRRYMYPDHDYYRKYISRYTPQTRLNMNVSGGTEKVQYFVNAGYLHQGGNLKTEPESQLGYDPSSWMDRFNFRSNLDYQVTESLKSFLNIASYIEEVNMPAAWLYGNDTNWMMTDLLYQAQTITPITPGPTTIEGFGVAPGQIVDPTYLDRSAFEIMNRMGYRNEIRSNLNSSLGLEWDLSNSITQGLNVKGMISYDTRATSAEQGVKRERLYIANVNPETNQLSYAVGRPDETLLSLSKGVDSRYSINIQGSINYNREFGGKHDVGGMILAQRDYWESNIGEIPYNVFGVAARATYGYDDRYLIEANLGYNGSEQFAPGNRFGFFPAGSVGWVISNENFLKDNKVLTNLKLRASYGKVGNDKIGGARFLFQDNITLGGGPLGSLGRGRGINQGLLGNPDLSWEVATKQNFGLDIGLFDDLSASFDYFTEERRDILITRGMVPSFQGVQLGNIPKVNMGEVDNQGYEIEMTYNKALSQDFFIQLRGNYSYNKNTVRYMDEPRRDDTYAYQYRSTGHPLATNWGYKIDYSNGNGFFNSQEELDEYLENTQYGFGSPRVGDFKYIDLNEDGIVDDKDHAPIGYSRIPGVTYGFNTNVQYKGIELTVFFQGVGNYSSNYANQGVWENVKEGTYFGYHRSAWTPERYASGAEITYPALSTRTTTNHVANEFFIMDRSFVRLKNIELAYNFPGGFLDTVGVQSLRVFIGGQNLYTWDNLELDHLDPENNLSLGYPVTKMATLGLNLNF